MQEAAKRRLEAQMSRKGGKVKNDEKMSVQKSNEEAGKIQVEFQSNTGG